MGMKKTRLRHRRVTQTALFPCDQVLLKAQQLLASTSAQMS
jgi:hypothetical protein